MSAYRPSRRASLAGQLPCLLGHARPGRRETFVGNPPQQEGIACGELIELELLLFFARELERPARVFYDAIQRHELRCDHSSHVNPPLVFGVGLAMSPLGIAAHTTSAMGASRNGATVDASAGEEKM